MIQIEEKDIPVRKIQWLAIGLVTSLILIGIILLSYQNHLVKDFNQTESWPATTPRQQAEFESGRIREQQQKEQMSNLSTYQGLNENSAWVQVPIDRAMAYLLEKKSTDPKSLFASPQGGSK